MAASIVESGSIDLSNALEDRGLRRTAARSAVTGRIEQLNDAFTAENLCRDLPDVGRATVYRTIRHLVDAGALCKLPILDGAPMYSIARVDHHHHTICVRCGAVGEFRHSTVERVLRSLEKEIDGDIVGHRMEIFITCRACLGDQHAIKKTSR
ncbi:MAG: Fur family transcriptional regulator [Chloroflexi bacterium]|nr:Fur family transcriptional regulator [Chloroflexota bacterium]